jgi:hypothetical protein
MTRKAPLDADAAEVQHGNDIRMRQARARLRFAFESAQGLTIAECAGAPVRRCAVQWSDACASSWLNRLRLGCSALPRKGTFCNPDA